MTSPAQRQALGAAATWFARIGAAPGDPALQAGWEAWHNESPLHQWAWQRLSMLQAQLGSARGGLGYNVLERADQGSAAFARRTLLKGLLLGVGIGALGWQGYSAAPAWMADLRTRTGERRSHHLDDGSRLVLNTASAVDIAFTAHARVLILRAGEIHVETAHDARPFSVRSAQGTMRARGTRFAVRQDSGLTRLSVFEHAVAVRPGQEAGSETVIEAGHALDFGDAGQLTPRLLASAEDAWLNGRLVVDGWRLDRLVTELQRYRSGYLGCAPEVGHLLVSGSYPLDDIDLALAAIARALPVGLVHYTPYWTRIVGNTASA